jgi:hypothetical protein
MLMRSNGFVAGGHECIAALKGCFDAVAQGRIGEPLSQIRCLFPASTFICSRLSSFFIFLDFLGEDLWELLSPARFDLPHVP